MTLFEYYLQYMTEVFEGKRQAPEGITLTAGDEGERMKQLGEQLGAMGMAEFVRRCAAQDGTQLPEALFEGDVNAGAMEFFAKNAEITTFNRPTLSVTLTISVATEIKNFTTSERIKFIHMVCVELLSWSSLPWIESR